MRYSKAGSPRWLPWLLVLAVAPMLRGVDCNGNGAEDDADVAEGFSEDCNENGIPDECEHLPIQLSLDQRTVEVAPSARVVASGDLDGDGDLDLVAGSRIRGRSTVSVFLNRGERRFEAVAEHDLEGNLYFLTVEDLDGDGDPDTVTANDQLIWVLLNEGDGTFSAPIRHEPPAETRFLAVADVSGDGVVELITANRSSTTVSVFSGSGEGIFTHEADFEAGDAPGAVTAADFDRDGDLDLATVNRRSLDFSLLVNSGGGAFAAPVSYPLEGLRPSHVRAGDFNGDGLLDLAAGTAVSYSVLMNDGGGGFTDAVNYPGLALGLDVGDFDGDGDLDLAAGTQPNALSIKVNDGSGRFGVAADFVAPNAPESIALGDFDDDGLLDAAVVTTSPSVLGLLWNGEGRAVSVATEIFPLPPGCQRDGGGCRPHSGTVADLDGDGDLDLIGANTHPGSFAIALNDGTGRLEVQEPHIFGREHPQSVAAGDLDGDGDLDAVTVDNLDHDLWVHLNNGDATFRSPSKYAVAGDGAPLNVKLADFDGDGDLDAVSANQGRGSVSVLLNQGDATFAGRQDLRVGRAPKAVEAVDLDGDGDPDIASANSSSASVSVILNDGAAVFAPAVHLELTSNPNHVASGDLNGDGHVDLVTASTTDSSCSVLTNRGDGTATFEEAVDYVVGRAPYSVVAADFDGDGALDLITANETSSSVSILFSAGDGTFLTPLHLSTGPGTGLRFALPADFDGDGDTDVATTNRTGRSFTIIYNQSTLEAEAYREMICTAADFQELSARSSTTSAAERFVKYTLPVAEGAALSMTVYQNTNRFPLHERFLSEVFPDQFPGLDPDVYDSLVGRRASRQYFVGTIARIRSPQRGVLYGVSVFARFQDVRERLAAEEVGAILEGLRGTFRLEPLVYFPNSRAAVEVAEGWEDPGFDIFFDTGGPSTRSYEPYTRAVGYGRVRLLTEAEFEAANDTGQLSFQDILVLDHAPRDIEGVVGGVITADPQGELSHVAIRTNRRGTPNAFVGNAMEAFAAHAGALVRLEVAEAGYTVEPVTPEQAEAFWESNRPELSVQPGVDPDFREFSSLEEIAAMDAAGGAIPVESRFGGKASNLARLQTILTGPWAEYRETGFGIPVHYYLEFIRSNRMPSALDPSRTVTYEEYIDELLSSEVLQTDSRRRFEALRALREHMDDEGLVDSDLVRRLAERIVETFDPSVVRVRFRSSSNAEDAIEFNGAGLYDSTSVCARDDLDGDGAGPSLCDETRANERGIARGLRRVWSSLWNFRAYEERAFYGMDQRVAAMGLLANRAFIDEAANGVAFTGNPANPLDRRYVITVQVGENSVVSPEPGVLPEKDILEMSEDGQVAHIIRAVASTLAPAETFILSDDQLRELGALLFHIDRSFPVDPGRHAREDLILDLEFKLEPNGDLAVKQVRPFLLTNPEPQAPTFQLVVPAGTVACGLFDIGRKAPREYELKSQLLFVEGTFELPTGVETFRETIADSILVGPERVVATPAGPGLFRVSPRRSDDGVTIYRFKYEQEYRLPDGGAVRLELSQIDFRARDGVPLERSMTLDSGALTDEIFSQITFSEGGEIVDVFYTSCSHETLPLWELKAELDDGSSIRLEERFRPAIELDFGPASLIRAEVSIGGERQDIADYWNLVYSATRHNSHEVYWVILEQPVTVAGVEQPVHGVELTAPIPVESIAATASYLGENLEVLSPVEVVSYTKELVPAGEERPFRRGDVDASGALNITDAISLLDYLFRGRGSLPCAKAADANDDGRLNVTDAVSVLLHLVAGGSLPAPAGECGADPTEDGLGCGSFEVCG